MPHSAIGIKGGVSDIAFTGSSLVGVLSVTTVSTNAVVSLIAVAGTWFWTGASDSSRGLVKGVVGGYTGAVGRGRRQRAVTSTTSSCRVADLTPGSSDVDDVSNA